MDEASEGILIMRLLWLCFVILLSSAATWADTALEHYGLMSLGSPAAEKDLQGRFKASGKPLFLVRDVNVGVTSGDIIRFSDKVVLVDAQVMQTLKASGALAALHQAPVLRLQAKSQSAVWKSRSTLVQNPREQKAYRLGGEVLKVFEDYFGKAPASEEIVLRFLGKDLEMLVPDELMDRLSFATVRKVVTGGTPVLISEPPQESYFQGDSIHWRVWGADPTEPEVALRYGYNGNLPPGVLWSDSLHALIGQMDSAGSYSLTVWVRNPTGNMDTMLVTLRARR